MKKTAKAPNKKKISELTDDFYTEKAVLQAYDLLNNYKSYYHLYRLGTGYDPKTGHSMGIGINAYSPEELLATMDGINALLLTNKAITKDQGLFDNLANPYYDMNVMSPEYVDKLISSLRSNAWYDSIISNNTFNAQVEGLRSVGSFSAGFVWGVGNVQSAVEAATGNDYITGKKVNKLGRVFAAAGVLLPQVKHLKKVGSVFKNADEVEEALSLYGKGVNSVPGVRKGKFITWFNSLTADELDELWKIESIRDTIKDRLRKPGGLHEWHLVSQTPTFKRWGVTAEEIRDIRTLTKDTKFVNPKGIHGGKGSTTAHNEMIDIIESSIDYDMFKRRIQNWADYRLEGGASALPGSFKRPQ